MRLLDHKLPICANTSNLCIIHKRRMAVYVTQSMTTKETREYVTPIGRFEFTCMKKDAFNIGIRNVVEDGYSFLIACPEKALCDLIANAHSLQLRYRNEALKYLEEDLRFDMDAFYKFNPSIFEMYINTNGKKSNSITTLLKLIKEYGQRDI